jgi:hypothetical protein
VDAPPGLHIMMDIAQDSWSIGHALRSVVHSYCVASWMHR